MKDCKIIVVHGIGGSAKSNFFPCLASIFDAFQLDYDISDYWGGSFNMFPNAEKWVAQINSIVKKTNKPIVLVGYSLGARAILMYLAANNIKVDTVILISAPPNLPRLGQFVKQGRVASFFRQELDRQNIKSKVNRIIQIHAKNDTTIPYFLGKKLSKEIESEFITFNNAGHFCKPSHAHLLAPIILTQIF